MCARACAHACAHACTQCTRAPIRTDMHAHVHTRVHTRHEGMPPAGPALCRFGTRVPGARRGLHGLLAVCRQREHQPGPLDSWPLPRTRPEAHAVRGSDPFRCLRVPNVPLVSSRASASPPGGRRSSRGAVPDFDGQSRATLAGPSLHLADSREAAARHAGRSSVRLPADPFASTLLFCLENSASFFLI